MFRRKIYDRLVEWRNRKHLPMYVYGPRGVGKTFIVQQFAGDCRTGWVYADLRTNKDARRVFEKGPRGISDLVFGLTVFGGTLGIEPHETLIVLDNVQYCPAAREAIGTFASDGRYDVIAIGDSLLTENHGDGACACPPTEGC